MAARPADVFRFLDLPPELRAMVYQYLPLTTRHYTLQEPQDRHRNSKPFIILAVKYFPVSIFATCRLINQECKASLKHTLGYLRASGVYFILADGERGNFTHPYRLMSHIAMILRDIEESKSQISLPLSFFNKHPPGIRDTTCGLKILFGNSLQNGSR